MKFDRLKLWKWSAWLDAYGLEEKDAGHFLRMVENGVEYYALPKDHREEWKAQKRKFSKSMPLLEQRPEQTGTINEMSQTTETRQELLA